MPKPKKKRPEPNRFRSEPLHVMLTASEKEELREAAALAGVPLSTWLRALGLKEARRPAKTTPT
jgi:hypothetical protein